VSNVDPQAAEPIVRDDLQSAALGYLQAAQGFSGRYTRS
jgi:hypothetical protein